MLLYANAVIKQTLVFVRKNSKKSFNVCEFQWSVKSVELT